MARRHFKDILVGDQFWDYWGRDQYTKISPRRYVRVGSFPPEYTTVDSVYIDVYDVNRPRTVDVRYSPALGVYPESGG